LVNKTKFLKQEMDCQQRVEQNEDRTDLSDSILLRVFCFLNTIDIGPAALVCRRWLHVSTNPSLWQIQLEKNLQQGLRLVQVIQDAFILVSRQGQEQNLETILKRIDGICSDIQNEQDYRADHTRLDLLLNTNFRIKFHLQQIAPLSKKFSTKPFCVILATLIQTMEEAAKILQQIANGEAQMTINFDVLELSVRRALIQLREMFPLNDDPKSERIIKIPSLLIRDVKAAVVWELAVGRTVPLCSYNYFMKNVLLKYFQSSNPQIGNKMNSFFSYFLNFPRDNIITTFKWHVFISLFGPFDHFMDNFENYVLGKGFCGFINRLYAKQILEKYPNHILIRFSRTEPTCLAITYWDRRTNTIVHTTNGPHLWADVPLEDRQNYDRETLTTGNVPLNLLLTRVFPPNLFPLVPLCVDTNSVLVESEGNLGSYVKSRKGYVQDVVCDGK